MWNRTRAIRQDFIVQGLRGALEIECHERIARYHILCLHWKGGAGAEGWSEQQELEQLRKTIRSLTEFYDDLRRSSGQDSLNEAEFRAYNLLLHMQDPETLREVEVLPSAVFDSACVQAALRLRGYAQRSNNIVKRGRPLNTESTMNLWTRFFGEIKRNRSVSYLLACLAENAFSQVRAGALKAMGRSYLNQHAPLPLEYLRRSLGMDDDEEARSFALALNCEEVHTAGPDSTVTAMRLGKASEEKPLPTAPFSRTIVEVKRGSYSSQDIVDGKLSGAAPLLVNDRLPPVAAAQIVLPVPRHGPAKLPIPANKAALAAPLPDSSNFSTTTLPNRTPTTSAFDQILSAAAPVFTPSAFSPVSDKKTAISTAESLPTLVPVGDTQPARSVQFSFAPPPAVSKPIASASRPSASPSARPPQPFSAAPAAFASTLAAVDVRPVEPIECEDSSTPTSTNVPVASSTSTHVPVASSTSTLPAKPTPITTVPSPAPTPMRTVASVASSLASTLISNFIEHKLETIGQQACLRELRIRRKAARRAFVEQATENLMSGLRIEAAEELLSQLGSEAIADEFRTRSLKKLALKGQARAGRQALERRRQKERLFEVRSKLQQRGLDTTKSHLIAKDGHASIAGGAVHDQQLEMALSEAWDDRRSLWTPGTFFTATHQRFTEVAPRGIGTWTVALSVCKTASATSEWLRLKLSPGDACDSGKVRMLDLEKVTHTQLAEERDVGLVVFELNPALTSDLANAAGWTSERERLEALSQQKCVSHSRFHANLLLLSWSPITTAQDEEARRKAILRHLRLGATDPQRFHWAMVELASLGKESVSPQVIFKASLHRVLKGVEWYQRKLLRFSLDAVGALCKASWKTLVEHVQVAFTQLEMSGESDASKDVGFQAFSALTVLASRSLEDLVSISDTLLEDQYEQVDVNIPLATIGREEAKAGTQSVFEVLRKVALVQLEECHQATQDDSFALLTSWLLEQGEVEPRRFPWLIYFEHLYQWRVSQIENVWLECKLPDRHDIEAHCAATSSLCTAAWTEIEAKVKEVMRVRRKRSVAEPVEEGASKVRRTGATQRDAAPFSRAAPIPSTPASAPSSAVSSLRAMMVDAATMLGERV